MLRWILLTAIVVAGVAGAEDQGKEESKVDMKDEASHQFVHDQSLRDEKSDHSNINVERVLNPQQIAFDPHNKKHRMIIENVNAPDYFEPMITLDYRYQKTGGRDWTRADGGQILILPKGIKSEDPKEYNFHDYDELIDYLRSKAQDVNKVIEMGAHGPHDHVTHPAYDRHHEWRHHNSYH